MSTALPILDLRTGHTVSTIVVALTGMMPGNYGDMITGADDTVHVTRTNKGFQVKGTGKRRWTFESDNSLRVAQFIANRIEA